MNTLKYQISLCFTTLLAAPLFGQSALAQADKGGNGFALCQEIGEVQKEIRNFIESADAKLFPKIDFKKMNESILDTKCLSAEKVTDSNGVEQDAVSDPSTNTILLNESRWKLYSTETYRKNLLGVHQTLALLGLEENGVYQQSVTFTDVMMATKREKFIKAIKEMIFQNTTRQKTAVDQIDLNQQVYEMGSIGPDFFRRFKCTGYTSTSMSNRESTFYVDPTTGERRSITPKTGYDLLYIALAKCELKEKSSKNQPEGKSIESAISHHKPEAKTIGQVKDAVIDLIISASRYKRHEINLNDPIGKYIGTMWPRFAREFTRKFDCGTGFSTTALTNNSGISYRDAASGDIRTFVFHRGNDAVHYIMNACTIR